MAGVSPSVTRKLTGFWTAQHADILNNLECVISSSYQRHFIILFCYANNHIFITYMLIFLHDYISY